MNFDDPTTEPSYIALDDTHGYIPCAWTDPETGEHWDLAAITEYHRKPDGTWCYGFVQIDGRYMPHADSWDLIQEEPLTLSPSLLCRACGSHGFIREGRWVPA